MRATTPWSGAPPAGDANYTYDGDGRKLTMVDSTGTSTWTYNTLGQETSYTNGAGKEVQYTPDANGNQTKRTYADSTVITQAFNPANKPCWTYVGTSSNACSSIPSEALSYTWDASGNLTAEALQRSDQQLHDRRDGQHQRHLGHPDGPHAGRHLRGDVHAQRRQPGVWGHVAGERCVRVQVHLTEPGVLCRLSQQRRVHEPRRPAPTRTPTTLPAT